MSQEGQHHPTESHAINQELRQEGQAESMTQASTTLLSQMLQEVIYRNSMHINNVSVTVCVNHLFVVGVSVYIIYYLSLRGHCQIVPSLAPINL